MKAGFHEIDITPRVGVELCGFGPFLNRHSIAVRDSLKAKAAAFQIAGSRVLMVSCDLIGVTAEIALKIKYEISNRTGLPKEAIMIHCTHTHSGPNTGGYLGWGAEDPPYSAVLPKKIIEACLTALKKLDEVEMWHCETPCEGIGLNREYDVDAPPLEEVLKENWRPAKPELTDTTCHVIKFTSLKTGATSGFMAYFGCHPVVCCQKTRHIHGDFCGVAMNDLQRENNGAIGLFLQGAQGDVNSCVVHKPEKESLDALEIIAARFADSVRKGLSESSKISVESLKFASFAKEFSTKSVPLSRLEELLNERLEIVNASGVSDETNEVRMAMVGVLSLRGMIERMSKGESLAPIAEIQGFRLGPLKFLSAPFEIMQAIKNEVKEKVQEGIPLVMGLTNGSLGYATDKTIAARGGYAADTVPIIEGMLPFANIHDELVEAFLKLDAEITSP